MALLQLENVTLEFSAPIARGRAPQILPSGELKKTGGRIRFDPAGNARVRALEDISLSLEPGDRLALLGHNGAGKTTLLRVMAGLYPPSEGIVRSEGRVAPLLNLSFGMDGESTGFDNIVMRGLFLGMRRAEIISKAEVIAEFSELGDFLHLPIRTYSSGMRARLAFAISTQVSADILLLDEVVATGDAAFVDKARHQLEYMYSQSKILVLASHANKVLRALCTKGLLLEHGRMKAFGPIDEVIAAYKGVAPKPPKPEPVRPARPPKVEPKVRVLLVNDTGGQPNPGCRAVRKGYRLLFDRGDIEKSRIVATLPVSYWMDSFRTLSVPAQDAVRRQPKMFPAHLETVAGVDIAEWERIRKSLAEADTDLQARLLSTNFVVLNGEGTIHHNSVRALASLALAKTCLEAGHRVVLLNATLQGMMPSLLQDALANVAMIHAREQQSHRFLEDMGLPALLAPDLAFLALDEEAETSVIIPDASSRVLVTAGVSANAATIEALLDAVRGAGMGAVYLAVGGGGEKALADRVCTRRNVPVVDAGQLGVKATIGFVRQFSAAICGRHSINMFLMRAGVPFVPLPSNTWKVEGTLQLVGYPMLPAFSYAEVEPMLRHVLDNRETFANAAHQSYAIGRRSVGTLVEQLATCAF